MKALILVGGFGTRLRPLTYTVPKPLIPFANKAIMLHQIEALVEVGVKEVVLAVCYRQEQFAEEMESWSKQYGIKITCSLEPEPMGTAGPLAIAADILKEGEESFFVLNSDVICQYHTNEVLKNMLAFHKSHGKEGTLLVTKVEDPSKYGVIISDAAGKIERFVEKPQTFVGDRINAGIYIFNPAILKRIPNKPTSIEREIFPVMAGENELYTFSLQGFWMDIGQPKDYLTGTSLFLSADKKYSAAEQKLNYPGVRFVGNVLIDPTATIAAGAVIGPDVVIGAHTVVGANSRVRRAILFNQVAVGAHATVSSTILGWRTAVGAHAVVYDAVFGANGLVGAQHFHDGKEAKDTTAEGATEVQAAAAAVVQEVTKIQDA